MIEFAGNALIGFGDLRHRSPTNRIGHLFGLDARLFGPVAPPFDVWLVWRLIRQADQLALSAFRSAILDHSHHVGQRL